mmetsp:Transcript_13306/g.24968  ORF Transcript_13306/g.24968 Transcript_13306/m.24968 type:complete len:266 (-) Transcript_13306:155-952(-)
MSINVINLPTIGLITLKDILRLSVFGHLIKSYLVGIIQHNKVIKLLMSSKSSCLSRNSLLETSISSKSKNVVIKDLVLSSVIPSLSHLLRSSESNSIGNSLSKRSSGTFNSRGVVFRVGEFGVAGGHGVVLTEFLELIHGKIVSGKVEPRVDEHGSVSGRKDEAITVHPLGVLGVVLHLSTIKSSSNLSSSKGKTHVTRVSSSNGVHGKTTSLVSSLCKSSLGINVDSGRLERHIAYSKGSSTVVNIHGESVNSSGHGRSSNCKS